MRKRIAVTAGVTGPAGLLIAAAAGLAGTGAAPALTLHKPLPTLVRIGQTAVVSGQAKRLPSHTRVALEGRRTTTWSALATARTDGSERFTIRWRIGSRTPAGPLSLRVVAFVGNELVAHTRAVQSAIGSRYIPCTRPVPPAQNIPVGDGWIVGGLYIQGGPYPGIDRCEDTAYTIIATSSSGSVAASEPVAAGHSYTLVVPAGTYQLKASGTGCPGSGQATVTAAKQTTGDVYCDVP